MKHRTVPRLLALSAFWLTAGLAMAAEMWSWLPEDHVEIAAPLLPVEVILSDADLPCTGRLERLALLVEAMRTDLRW